MHARGFKPETCAMDKGYDNTRVYTECEERGCEPVIPLRGAKANQVVPLALGGLCSRASRATLGPLRVRGLASVGLHADLTMLARLARAR
jgi:hypothetical protein